MKSNHSARLLRPLIGLILILSLFSGCSQQPMPTQVAAVQVSAPSATHSKTPAPTRTKTPRPTITVTRTATPTVTATPNIRETFVALTEAVANTVCNRYPDTWQVAVDRSPRGGWCIASGVEGSLYEYQVFYPSGWSVKAFGDLYPHLLFATGKSNTELRLYQVFSYYTRKEKYPIEQAPAKATFYDLSDKAFPVIKAGEKILLSERRTTLNHDVMVVDSQLGDLVIRRYFLFVLMKPALEPVRHLFYFELTTLKSLDPQAYKDLIDKTELMLTSLSPIMPK